MPNNLQTYEKEELVAYTEVYYYGQNCSLKKSSLNDLTKQDGGYNWLKVTRFTSGMKYWICWAKAPSGRSINAWTTRGGSQ